MAICTHCNQEMLSHVGCTVEIIAFADGSEYPRLASGDARESFHTGDDCHDCGCPLGTLHHPGCDMECCPRCFGQAFSCKCVEEFLDAQP